MKLKPDTEVQKYVYSPLLRKKVFCEIERKKVVCVRERERERERERGLLHKTFFTPQVTDPQLQVQIMTLNFRINRENSVIECWLELKSRG